MIELSHIRKSFKVARRNAGFGEAVRALFHREYETVRALDDVSFTIGDGEMVGYVPRKGLDMMTIEAKLAKGESVWRLDTMQEIKDGKIGINPGSGIMLFSGTKDEFAKLQQMLK